jgi:outer membrane lipoprotein carrier protein
MVAFILCVFGPAMWAAGPSQKGWAADQGQVLAEVWTVVKKLQARYRKTKDLQADFTQSTRIEGFATPLTSSGRVYIKKPGKLRWDYREPSVEEIYVNEDTVNIYVPEHQQVLVGDLTKMTASRAPLQLLQGMANLEEQFTVVPTDGAARGAGGLALVTLLPKPGEHGSDQNRRKIVLEVQPKTYFLKTVSIHDATGNVSTFAFSNLRPNTGLSDNVFRFRVPPGVEVVKAPELGGP